TPAQLRALRCRHPRGAATLEQRHAHPCLEFGQMPAHRRVRNAQFARSGTHSAIGADQCECPQRVQGQGLHGLNNRPGRGGHAPPSPTRILLPDRLQEPLNMLSNSLAAAAGLLLIAALSPGPNNLVVLRAAAHGGLSAAWPAIGGIVLGGLALLGLVLAGPGSTFAHWPPLRTVVAIAGAAYLCWMALGLMRPSNV